MPAIQRPGAGLFAFVATTMLSLAVGLPPAPAASPDTSTRLHDLVEQYYEEFLTLHPILATYNGDHRFDDRFTIAISPEMVEHAEVKRLESEIAGVRRGAESSGAPVDYGDGRLLDGYRSLRTRVESKLPSLFELIPRADFEIRPVESFRRQSSAGASYMAGTPDGSRKGVFYVNADENRRGTPSEALFLHEALPGHHFQISLQRELGELPRFRRFGHHTAFAEGWGLYVESLGAQLGLYRSREQKLRALNSELFRARRLVVDTGLHAMGWSREAAIDYIGSVNEVDRYIVMPGQALAYKVGQLHILKLRERARQALGERFDIRAFHRVVLEEGATPLDVLEDRVDAWIASQASATQTTRLNRHHY